MLKKYLFFTIIFITNLIPAPIYAAKVPLGTISGTGNLNPTNLSKNTVRDTFNSTISALLGLLTLLGGLYFLFQIIFAGYTILNSSGDSAKLSEGRQKITFGVLGLAIVVAAYLLIALIANLLGLTFIYNPLKNAEVFR